MITSIKILDIRNKKIKSIRFRDILPEIITKIEKECSNIGFRLKISLIDNPEEFIKNYYIFLGYKLIRTTFNGTNVDYDERIYMGNDEEYETTDLDIVKSYIKNKYNLEFNNITQKGVPDYIVYKIINKNIIELFFIEIKTNINDALRFTQLIWILNHNIPTKLVIVT